MRRYSQIVKVKSDRIEDYERTHKRVWPEVLATIHDCNMRNYSIFRHGNLLFA
jgi:L-rhamnose mutarotase